VGADAGLYMAIPDDVAQYAEGHRITSYFALTDVRDGERGEAQLAVDDHRQRRGGDHPYDFDSFRVFTWSLRRHRYETAYIQRNVEGYFPVLARPAGFLRLRGGQVRRAHAAQLFVHRFTGHHARCVLPGAEVAGNSPHAPAPGPVAESRSLYARLKVMVKKWLGGRQSSP
jgi:hypothetical protein